MTAKAQRLCVQLRHRDLGVVGMFQQRAVAGLTGDDLVLRWCGLVDLVFVSFSATCTTGIRHRLRCDVCDRAGAVMAVLAEIVRHKLCASDGEEQDACSKERRQPNQMFNVLQWPVHLFIPGGLRPPRLKCQPLRRGAAKGSP